MKQKFFIRIIALFLMVVSMHQLSASTPPIIGMEKRPSHIKILLTKQSERACLEAKGRYFVYNADNNALLTITSAAKRDYLSAVDNGLKWGKHPYTNAFRIRLIPDGNSTLLIDGIEYGGSIFLEARKDKVCIINEIDIEHYLACTLSTAFPSDLEPEALEAAVIVARTNAYFHIQTPKNPLWDVSAKDVGYEGSYLMHRSIPVDRAIDHTQHVALFYEDGPFPATWTENCAGKTADYSAIFRKSAPMPKGVNAPLAALQRKNHQWTYEMSKNALAKSVGLPEISSVSICRDEKSNKIYGLQLKYRDKEIFIDFFTLQKLLSPIHIKSNDFAVRMKGQEVLFTGYGKGHGVGLCLYSAQQMAKDGQKPHQILSTFFPEAQLKHCVEPH